MENIDGIGGGQTQWRGGGLWRRGICDGGKEQHLAAPAPYLQHRVAMSTLHGRLQLAGEARDGKTTHRQEGRRRRGVSPGC